MKNKKYYDSKNILLNEEIRTFPKILKFDNYRFLNKFKFFSNSIINKKKFIFFLLFLISYSLFYFSLEKCYEGEDICCTKINWMEKKIIEEAISCFIFILI